MVFPPETDIDGKYKIEKVIGSGGYGAVYLAYHQQLARQVALKVLHDPLDDIARKRLVREGKMLCKIRHKNVVSIYECGVFDGQAFLVMELINGTSIEDILTRDGIIEFRRALRIGQQICSGLQAAHVNGILHRDLKPTNVLLTGDAAELVKIIDFGLGRLLPESQITMQRLTEVGTAIGTVQYMSPEQCFGMEATVQSDIYAFGCLLYHCLTGIRPFAAESPVEVMYKHTKELPAPIRVKTASGQIPIAEIQIGIQRLMGGCLAKRANERFESAQSVAAEIERLLKLCGDEDEITVSVNSAEVSKELVAAISPTKFEKSGSKNALLSKVAIGTAVGMLLILFTTFGFMSVPLNRFWAAQQAIWLANKLPSSATEQKNSLAAWALGIAKPCEGLPEYEQLLSGLGQLALNSEDLATTDLLIKALETRQKAAPILRLRPLFDAVQRHIESIEDRKLSRTDVWQWHMRRFELSALTDPGGPVTVTLAKEVGQTLLDDDRVNEGNHFLDKAVTLAGGDPLLARECESIKGTIAVQHGRFPDAMSSLLKLISIISQNYQCDKKSALMLYHLAQSLSKDKDFKPTQREMTPAQEQRVIEQLLDIRKRHPNEALELTSTIALISCLLNDEKNAAKYSLECSRMIACNGNGEQRHCVHAGRIARNFTVTTFLEPEKKYEDVRRLFSPDMDSPYPIQKFLAMLDYCSIVARRRDFKNALVWARQAEHVCQNNRLPLMLYEQCASQCNLGTLEWTQAFPNGEPLIENPTDSDVQRHLAYAATFSGMGLYPEAISEFQLAADYCAKHPALKTPYWLCHDWAHTEKIAGLPESPQLAHYKKILPNQRDEGCQEVGPIFETKAKDPNARK